MEGGSLADRLEKDERPTMADLMGWLSRLRRAHLRASGGSFPWRLEADVDRVRRAGRAYVTEFALASRAGDKGRRELLGATDFLSPEQLEGEEAVAAPAVFAGGARVPDAVRYPPVRGTEGSGATEAEFRARSRARA